VKTNERRTIITAKKHFYLSISHFQDSRVQGFASVGSGKRTNIIKREDL